MCVSVGADSATVLRTRTCTSTTSWRGSGRWRRRTRRTCTPGLALRSTCALCAHRNLPRLDGAGFTSWTRWIGSWSGAPACWTTSGERLKRNRLVRQLQFLSLDSCCLMRLLPVVLPAHRYLDERHAATAGGTGRRRRRALVCSRGSDSSSARGAFAIRSKWVGTLQHIV